MKNFKRYLACFIAILIILESIHIVIASNISINDSTTYETNILLENKTNTSNVNLNELELKKDITLEIEENNQIEIEKIDSNEQPSNSEDNLKEENYELGLVFYDSSVDNGKTPLTEINWNASDDGYKQGESRVITLEINYDIENTETLNKGDIQISIPNIIYNSYENNSNSPLWNTSVLLGANDANHTGYEFLFTAGSTADISQEYYTFENEISLEPSIHKGNIQIIYTITPQEEISPTKNFAKIEEYENQCTHKRNMEIIATMNNANSSYEVTSNSLLFNYERTYIHDEWKRVDYTLTQTADKIVSYDGLSEDAEDYIWIKYTFLVEHSSNEVYYPNIHADKLHIIDNIPNDCLVYHDGKQISNNIDISVSYKNPALSINDISYSYELLRLYDWKYEFYVGYPKEIYKDNTILGESSELYGIYKDTKTEEKLDDSFININLSEFEFQYDGDPETGLYNISTYHDQNSSRKRLIYQDIINPDKEYFGYRTASNVENWKISFVARYKGIPMTLKISDDVLSSTNIDGTIKKLNDDEYYFENIVFCGNDFTNASGIKIEPNKYNCELYVRYRNTDEYILHSSFKNPNGNKTINFEKETVVGWYIMIYDITETVEFNYDKVQNMNDYNLKSILVTKTIFQKKTIPHSGSLYNFVYMNVYYRDGENFILQNETSEELYDSEITKELLKYDLEIYGHCMQRNYGESKWDYHLYNVSDSGGNLSSETKFNEIIQDNINERFIGSCDIATKINVPGAGVSQEMMYVEEFNQEYMMQGFKMYDLLPAGVELISTEEEIKNSLNVIAHDYHRLHAEDGTLLSGGNASIGPHLDIIENAIITDVIIKENWNNTGRTKIEIIGTITEKLWFTSYYYGAWYQFNYKYDYSIPYESYMEYGNIYTNNLYVDKFDTQTKGYGYNSRITDNGQNDSDAIDIDEDGNINDFLSFKNDFLTINAIFSSYQNISMKAKTDLSNFDSGVINTSYDSEYTYRLGITTGSNSIKNVIFYDNLEESFGKQDYWKGDFLGIDTSYAENKGFIVKTYYSENKDANNLYDENKNFNSEWDIYSELVDKNKVESIAFEFFDNEGNPAIIPSSTLMYVLINMKAPNNESINSLAYNNFHVEWNIIDSLGFESLEKTKLNSNTVKIALPNSLKSFGSYLLQHEYYVRDRHGKLILENIISDEAVEDIFEGIEINASDLEHKYENNEKKYQLLEEDSVIIEANIVNYITIKYVRDEYLFKIEWDDNDSSLRPENYEVSLKKDGVIVETKIISSKDDTCTFVDYPKNSEGKEHIYEFEVNIGNRYELIYDTERDIYIAKQKESNFSVKIPKTIILDGITGSADYDIITSGNLYYNDTLTIEPENSMIMKDIKNISSIQANIYQERIFFTKENIGVVHGKIQVTKTLFAGHWSGVTHFCIKFIKQN